MTRTSVYNRVVITLIFILTIAHSYYSHYEENKMISALTNHQVHSIEAFTEINKTLADGILHQIEARRDKDALQAKEGARPTPTPSVITKTKTRTRYIKRPTPKPFKLFGPN
jgi:hypothetical protein